MFSSSMVKTFPLASQAMHVGGVDGRAKITGPVRSVDASAVTQLVSSFESGGSSPIARVSCAFELEVSSSAVGALRFLDFLSPLKERGLTMLSIEFRNRDQEAHREYQDNEMVPYATMSIKPNLIYFGVQNLITILKLIYGTARLACESGFDHYAASRGTE